MVLYSGIFAAMLFFGGCVHLADESSLNRWVAPSPDHAWTPPPGGGVKHRPAPKPVGIPESLLQPGTKWRLADIVEIALRNNPETRSAWYAARSAAADWLSKKGSYYPQIDADAGVSHIDASYHLSQGGKSVSSFEPGIRLNWLLLDFGGRDASVEEKRQALLAADFTHNAAIQDSVFQVLQAYFQYANAKALKKSLETSVNDAKTNLSAAEQRHRNGLATIADVLQAKTALSQAWFNLETAAGQVQIIRGSLATAMGIPANTPYDIEDLPVNPPVNRMTETVDAYIAQAQSRRPDLAAQKSRVEQSLSRIQASRSALYPSLSLTNSFGGTIDNHASGWEHQNTAGLMLSIPIFKGYSGQYDKLKTEQDAEAQKAQLDSFEQTIIFQVWSSYFNLKTSEQRVKTSNDLLQSAQQSHDVALGRYKEGVGGFLDLLAAQTALANARAQRIFALADWYISLASLARDTGTLWRREPDKNSITDILPAATIKETEVSRFSAMARKLRTWSNF
ncbi:MAG: TolC family protein [Desulfosalsimonadaceae bacterium]